MPTIVKRHRWHAIEDNLYPPQNEDGQWFYVFDGVRKTVVCAKFQVSTPDPVFDINGRDVPATHWRRMDMPGIPKLPGPPNDPEIVLTARCPQGDHTAKRIFKWSERIPQFDFTCPQHGAFKTFLPGGDDSGDRMEARGAVSA